MFVEPVVKRTIAFVDGQNLYHNVRTAFGYTHPNYDIEKLARAVCTLKNWQLDHVYFYTGIPTLADNPRWHDFWTKKLAALGRVPNVTVYSRPLVYRNGIGQEKGIDVRLALDALDCAHRNLFDVALIFSQDQDLSELATLIRQLSRVQDRWIKIASAYPVNQAAVPNPLNQAVIPNKRGINATDWCSIDQSTYDACIDPRDYRV